MAIVKHTIMSIAGNREMKISRLVKNSLILVTVLFITGCTIVEVTSSTSGTLDAVTPDITLNKFVDLRFANIQKDAAQGDGENLDTLAKLMGKSDRKAFSTWVHNNYENLFSDLAEPSQLISRIETQGRELI